MSVNKSNSTSSFHDVIQDSCSSKFKYRSFQLKWTIEDLRLVCKTMKVLESPRFPFSETETLKWYIRLEPTPLKERNKEFFRIYLKNTENINGKLLRVNIDLCSSSKIIISFIKSIGKFDTTKSWYRTGEELIQILFLKVNPVPNELTVICNLHLFDSGINIVEKPLAVSPKSDGLSEHMENFLDDQIHKDIKFIVQDEEINAHKAILACRSPVFSAMFKNKMTENLTSIVKIEDIKPSTFHLMLRFIYTDEVKDLEESAMELFYAAEKYQLEKLKIMCLNSLYNNLSEKNVVKILQLADTFSIMRLKDKAQDYLVSCLEAVQESEEYLELTESHPDLVAEILKQQKKVDLDDAAHIDCPENMIFEYRP